jgi:hypothetical protein
VSTFSSHVPSERLGDAASHASLDGLRDAEKRHLESCDQCRRLFGGYRLADRLLAADWREMKLPAAAVARPGRAATLAARLGGLDLRSAAPVLAVVAIVVLAGAAFALPQLMPTPPVGETHTPVAAATTPPAQSGSVSLLPGDSGQGRTQGTLTFGSGGPGVTPPAGQPTPPSSGGSPVVTSIIAVETGGTPIAWSPDGSHLLLWGSGAGHPLEIRDAAGHLTGSVAADAATWVGPATIAIATRAAAVATASPSSRGSGGRGGSGPGSGGFGPGTGGPGPTTGGNGEAVSIIGLTGHVTGTIPGSFQPSGGNMLLGSGSGELAIAGQGGASQWSFVLWNGAIGHGHSGLPIAFSADGGKLAVLHPTRSFGGNITGTLEIVAVPTLKTIASFGRLTVRVGAGRMGSQYGFDAAFSPNGRSLLVSGTLIDLTTGASQSTGKGGWLPDGTLVTASNNGMLRWRGGRATADPRLAGAGTVETSLSGDLIYFYSDGRQPLLLGADGTLRALSLSGVRSVGNLLISPSGRTLALDGRATDGSSITAVAGLP